MGVLFATLGGGTIAFIAVLIWLVVKIIIFSDKNKK